LMTVWIPFTDATPENGCIRVLPISRDPNLPHAPSLSDVPRPEDVVVIPARAGAILGWNQLLLHGGGKCSTGAQQPRISVGIYVQASDRPDYETAVPFDEALPLSIRLRLIAHALHRYCKTFHFPREALEFVGDQLLQPERVEIASMLSAIRCAQ